MVRKRRKGGGDKNAVLENAGLRVVEKQLHDFRRLCTTLAAALNECCNGLIDLLVPIILSRRKECFEELAECSQTCGIDTSQYDQYMLLVGYAMSEIPKF